MALALSASCLSAPPQEAPSSGAECHRAHQYSLDRHRDISDQYQRTNLLLGATGAVLWFGFVEALAIPVVGMPLSYYQYEQLAKRNLDSLPERRLQLSIDAGTIELPLSADPRAKARGTADRGRARILCDKNRAGLALFFLFAGSTVPLGEEYFHR